MIYMYVYVYIYKHQTKYFVQGRVIFVKVKRESRKEIERESENINYFISSIIQSFIIYILYCVILNKKI